MAPCRNAAELAARMPSAELLALVAGGHMLLGNDETVGSSVRRFVAAHDVGVTR
jgi:hypothetical protein